MSVWSETGKSIHRLLELKRFLEKLDKLKYKNSEFLFIRLLVRILDYYNNLQTNFSSFPSKQGRFF